MMLGNPIGPIDKKHDGMRHAPPEARVGSLAQNSLMLWILNHYAATPERQATRSYDLGKELVKRGHRVTIFAAGFSHYSFREECVRRGEISQTVGLNGVRSICGNQEEK